MSVTGRRRSEIQIIVGPNRHPFNPQTLAEYAAEGADQIVVPVFASNMAKLEQRLDALMAVQPAA
jgi:hypothetical protein